MNELNIWELKFSNNLYYLQGKDKLKHPGSNLAGGHKAVANETPQQRSYLDQMRAHDPQRSFQEQMRAQEKRAQSDRPTTQEDPAKFSQPAAVAAYHPAAASEPKKTAESSRSSSHLDAMSQFGVMKAGDRSPDKVKVGRSSQDHISPDLRQRSHQDQKHQQELKKHVEPYRNQYDPFTDSGRSGLQADQHQHQYQQLQQQHQQQEVKDSQPGVPQPTNQSYSYQKQSQTRQQQQQRRPSSPRQHQQQQQGLASCRVEQQDQRNQEQLYPIPSATPADKLPGFVPSIAHSREQKQRQNLEQQQLQHQQHLQPEHAEPTPVVRKGRDTPTSQPGSETSHNSGPSGIPNELLDSVLETAKLPVWKPPDKVADVQKMASPAKPPLASPPKPAPVIPERDTELEELVKHIDASPSPRENRVEKLPSNNVYQSSPASTKSSSIHQAEQQQSSSSQLIYSNIPGLMGTSVSHSDKDTSEAERSDYDFDQHDKGGVDYHDDDDDDDLPLSRRKHVDTSQDKDHQQLDISSWKTDATADRSSIESTKEKKESIKLKLKVKELPPLKPELPTKAASSTKRGTKVPIYKEEPEIKLPPKQPETPAEKAPEVMTRRGTKVPCYKEKEEKEESPSRLTIVKKSSVPVKGGKVRGRGVFGGRRQGPKYDQKAFERVHKNLVGTDFDFEDEFDDDGGFTPKEDLPGSLRDFRQQTKTKNSNDSFDFDDFDDNSGVAQMPPVLGDEGEEEEEDEDVPLSVKAKTVSKAKSKARGSRTAARADPPVVPKIIPLKINLGPAPPKEERKKAKLSKEEKRALKEEKKNAKIPKLKIKIGTRNESPAPAPEESAMEKEASLPPPAPILKLKIKLPPKPQEDKPVPAVLKEDLTVPAIKVHTESLDLEPIRSSEKIILKSSSPVGGRGKLTPQQQPRHLDHEDPDLDDLLPPKQDFSLESLKSDFVKSSPRSLPKPKPPTTDPPDEFSFSEEANSQPAFADTSPKKSKAAIENLANKLRVAKQTTSITTTANSAALPTDKESEIAAIFGPETPLPVLTGPEESEEIAAAADKADEGPSELDLLTMELKKLEKEKQQKEEESKKEDDLKQAEKPLETLVLPDYQYDEDAQKHHHHLKYKKLKPSSTDLSRNTTSPGPNTPVKISLTQPAGSADPGRIRMRKKELLNSYMFGTELATVPAPAPASNGPVEYVQMHRPPPPSHHQPTETPKPKEPGFPVRMNIIKIPKAVASVTSVPTRADYQSQMEANMERKRKREGKEDPKVKGQKKGKGKQNKNEEDVYRPKIKKTSESGPELEDSKEVRRTRGMPIKKCLREESPEKEGPLDSFKKSQLRYGEEMLKQFEEDNKDRRKKDKKRRREEDDKDYPKEKTPRIVIKFSKTKEQQPKTVGSDSNGLTKPVLPELGHNITKLKIKPL